MTHPTQGSGLTHLASITGLQGGGGGVTDVRGFSNVFSFRTYTDHVASLSPFSSFACPLYVLLNVQGQRSFPGEQLPTLLTLEVLESVMHTLMLNQVSLLQEHLATLLTLVLSDAYVDGKMAVQVARAGKPLAANLALVFLDNRRWLGFLFDLGGRFRFGLPCWDVGGGMLL